MQPSACGLGQHFQDLGHSFSLYGPPSRQITQLLESTYQLWRKNRRRVSTAIPRLFAVRLDFRLPLVSTARVPSPNRDWQSTAASQLRRRSLGSSRNLSPPQDCVMRRLRSHRTKRSNIALQTKGCVTMSTKGTTRRSRMLTQHDRRKIVWPSVHENWKSS